MVIRRTTAGTGGRESRAVGLCYYFDHDGQELHYRVFDDDGAQDVNYRVDDDDEYHGAQVFDQRIDQYVDELVDIDDALDQHHYRLVDDFDGSRAGLYVDDEAFHVFDRSRARVDIDDHNEHPEAKPSLHRFRGPLAGCRAGRARGRNARGGHDVSAQIHGRQLIDVEARA
jgi:hypothetical protein